MGEPQLAGAVGAVHVQVASMFDATVRIRGTKRAMTLTKRSGAFRVGIFRSGYAALSSRAAAPVTKGMTRCT